MRTAEASGKTIEEAKQKVAAKLGVPEHDVEFEVLEVGARGFLGLFGGNAARVRGTYYETKRQRHSAAQASPRQGSPAPPEEEERPARGRRRGGRSRDGRDRGGQRPPQAAGREPQRPARQERPDAQEGPDSRGGRGPQEQQNQPRGRQPRQQGRGERQPVQQPRPAPQPQPEAAKPAEAEPKAAEAAPKRRERQPRRPARTRDSSVGAQAQSAAGAKPASTGVDAVSVDARAAEALDFIKKMIDAGDLGATARVSEVVEDGFEIEIDGGRSELLVGRGGNALDALQFLVGIIVNRKHEGKVRITIDAAGYRRKHKEALEAMALEIAGQVIEHDQEAELDPQPPRDRRIIHNVLKEHPDVYTYSEGEGDRRHVVISPKKD
jgi:spoIIIJ-associated protein